MADLTAFPSLKSERVLVTGGAGFIGSHLVDALVACGASVRILDDLSTGRRENVVASGVELVVGDIRDLRTCRDACDGVSLVFHEAALGSVPRSLADPATTIAVNVGGTANVFAAAREKNVRRVVYASSSSVYGDSTASPKREGEEGRPLSPYAASKVMSEGLAEVFGRCYGLEMVGLRYFNVYGPRQSEGGPYAAVIPAFLRALRAGKPPLIYGDGTQSRDFTYVADAVRANLLAATAAVAPGDVFNVAGGRATTIGDLAARLGEALGRPLVPTFTAPRPGDVRNSVADLSRAERALGYRPTFDLGTGLAAVCRGSLELPESAAAEGVAS